MSEAICISCRGYLSDPQDRIRVPGYGFELHRVCWGANWDGYAGAIEGEILQYLKNHGIRPPKRNRFGNLPRSF